MLQLIGEFECKLDAKGRLVVPSALKRQLPDVERDGLIINRGFEKNLVVYTREEWDKQAAKISKLNTFNAKNREFVRQFMRGATILTLDAAGRVLLPKVLLDYAKIEGEIVLACQFDRIEVWPKAVYDEMMNSGVDDDFAVLAEEVMGSIDFGGVRMSDEVYHVPVMLHECIEALDIKANGVYVDVTFGGGGHSREILKYLGPKGRLIAFDQDPDAVRNAIDDERFVLVHHNFRFLKNSLRLQGVRTVDGILADLGVSSHQFDDADRGFSIRFDADLDMRMDQVSDLDACKVLNTYSEEDLHRVFGMYGEVQNAKSLAKTIVTARLTKEIRTVAELKEVVRKHVPRGKEHKYHAQVFQALRIEVNSELDALQEFLLQAEGLLSEGGRLVVMSYHSLEDRLVKNFMLKGKFKGEVEKDFYGNEIKPFKVISRKAIVPAQEEMEQNTRSGSAKLRIAEKI